MCSDEFFFKHALLVYIMSSLCCDLLTVSVIDNNLCQNSSKHKNEKLINGNTFFKEYNFGAPSPRRTVRPHKPHNPCYGRPIGLTESLVVNVQSGGGLRKARI